MKISCYFVAVFVFLMLPLGAEGITSATTWGVDGYYGFPHNEGYGGDDFVFPNYTPEPSPESFSPKDGDQGRTLGSGWGSVKLLGWLSHRITLPLLRIKGEGSTLASLTKDNGLAINLKASLSPITLGGDLTIIFTPLAFLDIQAGAHLGTGWELLGLNGLGLNSDGTGTPDAGLFNGGVVRFWGGGTLKFDLAAVIPGKWNHLVALAQGKLEYQHYTRADEGDSWMYLMDTGENFNGWRYRGTYFLGYQMPLKVKTLGILVETTENMGDVRDLSPLSNGGWGSDFREIILGPLCRIQLTQNSSLVVLLQFKNGRRYTDQTIFYNWFQNREGTDTYWRLDRLAFSMSFKL